MKKETEPESVTGGGQMDREKDCYICGKPKDEQGEMGCSYPHARVPVAPVNPDHPEGFWTWEKRVKTQ